MGREELTLNGLAKRIYDGAGGLENIQTVNHCMTRIRMNIRDSNQVDQKRLKSIPGVLGVIFDEQLQVIIGPGKVTKVANEMVSLAVVELGENIKKKFWKRKS